MKIKKRYKVKKNVKELLFRVLITLVILVADIVIYHYLGIYGACAGKNTWTTTFILVGWFWLLAGQFMWLYFIWEQ